jgi:membrane protein DedA with SNARE-associated domain
VTRLVIYVFEVLGYAGIALLMFAENIFPPVPSEFIMPLAGFMVSEGKMTFVGVAVAGTVGSVAGTLPYYILGQRLSERRLRSLTERYGRWFTISFEDLERANRWFERHGAATVLFCRLIPGARTLISLPAGLSGMNTATFLTFTAIGTAVWTCLLAGLGYVLKSNFHEVDAYLDPLGWAVIVIVIGVYIYRVLRRR